MSDTDFRSVVDALSATAPTRPDPVEPVRRIAVLGAGAVGQLLACEALAAGLEVSLYTVFGRELDQLSAGGGITVRGAHLVGSYSVGEPRPGRPSIRLPASVDEAVAGADIVLVATPASAHATYAGLLAGALCDDQVVVLVPGRFLGSVALRQELERHHCPARVMIAELAAAPYLATRDGAAVRVNGLARSVDLASLPVAAAPMLASRLAPLLPMLRPVDSPLVTAFGTLTGVVSVAPLVTNTAVLDSSKGGSVLLRDLVPPSLSVTLIRDLDDERREVAFHYGVRNLPSAGAWLRAAYDDSTELEREAADDDVATVLAEVEMFDDVTVAGTGGPHITDDVPNTLVPLALAGKAAGVPTPATDTVVALAGLLVGTDLSTTGRSLEALGLGGVRPADVRRRLSEAVDHEPRTTTWWSV